MFLLHIGGKYLSDVINHNVSNHHHSIDSIRKKRFRPECNVVVGYNNNNL